MAHCPGYFKIFEPQNRGDPLKLKEFLQYIEKGTFQPIECLVTHEVLLEKKLIEHIQKKYPQVSLKTFYGSECEVRDILNELYQTDLFSARKLIAIKEFHELKWDEDSIASFKKILSDPNLEHRIVIIISDLKKIPSRVNQFIQSIAHVMEIKTIYPNEMQDYIQYHTQKIGKKIEKSAVDALIEQLGTDLQEFHSQMEKILLYVREKETIELKDVLSLVGMTSHHTIFQLVDALMGKNRQRVLQIAGRMLASGQHPLLLLSLIIKQFQQLEWDADFIHQHAQKFNRQRFREEMEAFIREKWKAFEGNSHHG